jgi:site-specific DNA recombinase
MKTAIYLRQSLDRDLTKVGIDYQREHLLKLCAAKGWDDPVEYIDRNISATKGTRPAYNDLCEDIRGGVVGKVAVWDMDRLHRQPRELEDFMDLAAKHGVELANVGGDVDLSTPSGRMFARMKGTVAKYEVEQKSAR